MGAGEARAVESEESDQARESFARRLGSSDKLTRDKGVVVLTKWMCLRQDNLSDDELQKVWKGLFYAMWHADKSDVQLELADNIARILTSLDDEALSIRFFRMFLLTMRREWAGIDSHRLNKFYLFIRRFLHHVLEYLRVRLWRGQLVKRFMSALLEGTLLARDAFIAAGLNYHVADIYVDELVKFAESFPSAATWCDLLEPFIVTLAQTKEKILLQRIREGVISQLLKMVSSVENKDRGDGGVSMAGGNVDGNRDALLIRHLDVSSIAERVFNLASEEDTPMSNRKVLYGLYEEMTKVGRRRKLVMDSGHGAAMEVDFHGEDMEETVHGANKEDCTGSNKKKKRRKIAAAAGAEAGGGRVSSGLEGNNMDGVAKGREAGRENDGDGNGVNGGKERNEDVRVKGKQKQKKRKKAKDSPSRNTEAMETVEGLGNEIVSPVVCGQVVEAASDDESDEGKEPKAKKAMKKSKLKVKKKKMEKNTMDMQAVDMRGDQFKGERRQGDEHVAGTAVTVVTTSVSTERQCAGLEEMKETDRSSKGLESPQGDDDGDASMVAVAPAAEEGVSCRLGRSGRRVLREGKRKRKGGRGEEEEKAEGRKGRGGGWCKERWCWEWGWWQSGTECRPS